MLEIIALVFLTRKMGELASRKGEKPGTWKLFTVLAWIGGEILGAVLAITFFNVDGYIGFLPFALMGAIGGYLIVRATLSKKPDVDNNMFDFEQKSTQP